MFSIAFRILAVFLFAAASARAGMLAGYVDGIGSAGAGGWACDSHASANISVAAYAGPILLGVYPTTASRPDVAPYCSGAQQHGFSIAFDAATQAMFAGQSQITLFEVMPGQAPRLLPTSNAAALNPLPLPSGSLLGVTSTQQIAASGEAGGGASPVVSLFAGAPSGAGGRTEAGTAQTFFGGSFAAQLPVGPLSSGAQAGALVPVFGAVTSTLGVTAPLNAALALVLANGVAVAEASVPLTDTVAQGGAVSGIHNTVFTTWLPPDTGFAGLNGTVSLLGNDQVFNEGLVEVGTTALSQAACRAQNGQAITGAPAITRLWAGILKSNFAAPVSIPVNFTLPYAVPGSAGGTCVMTWVSVGYPYLSATRARYATMNVALRATLAPAAPSSQRIIPYGLGGEYRFTGAAAPTSTLVGIMASKPLAVDGIAGTLSAAPVAGAPASSGWLPLPSFNWAIGTNFMYIPAASCTAANFHITPSNGTFAVLRSSAPGNFAAPPGAVTVLAMPVYSSDLQAIQRSSYTAFPPGAGTSGFAGRLNTGDCLVAYMTASIEKGAILDMENQSTVFLRLNP